MYICICHGVTDKKIVQTIKDGSTNMRALSKELGVGTQCGKCTNCTKRILNEQLIDIVDVTEQVA
jgi:bacterioferritin-associated ferredoxin